MSSAYIQGVFRLDFIMEVNTLKSDQTAREQAGLGPYCLQYRLPK